MERAEWLAWRHRGLGGSDAPIVMGVSRFKTPLQLYEEKSKEAPKDEPSNFVADRGNRFEIKIRSLYSLCRGEEFHPALLQDETIDWLKVSLDGISECKRKILEIKTVGKKVHEATIESNSVPAEYYPQVQHALMVSKADVCFYLSYWDEEWKEDAIDLKNLHVVQVLPDPEYQLKLLNTETDFWNGVLRAKPPEVSEGDFKKVTGHAKLVNDYAKAKQKLDDCKKHFETLEEEVLKVYKETKHSNCLIGKLKVITVERAGSVDYKAIPELKGVDLEKYRKAPSTYPKISVQE